MKNIKSVFYSVLLILMLVGPLVYLNSSPVDYPQDTVRVGCGCCDGTPSDATGRGACSHHGGVKYWIYYNDITDKYTYKCTGKCDCD